MIRSFIHFVFPVLSVTVSASWVSAGGLVFRGPPGTPMKLTSQTYQEALIVHKAGVQQMVVSLRYYDRADEGAVWCFPLACPRDKVSVRVLDDAFTPGCRIRGSPAEDGAATVVGTAIRVSRCTQLYPLLFYTMRSCYSRMTGIRGLFVHCSDGIFSHGLNAEMYQAHPVAALIQELHRRGVLIDQSGLAALKPFLNPQYSLVVTTIQSTSQFRKDYPHERPPLLRRGNDPERSVCPQIDFPAADPFYPMSPIASPAGIDSGDTATIVGYYKVKGHPRDSGQPYLGYVVQSKTREGLSSILPQKAFPYPIPYTCIDCREPTTDGLPWVRLVPDKSPRLIYALLIAQPPVIATGTLALTLLISYLSGGLAGAQLYGEWKPYGVLGLWNLMSILQLHLMLQERSAVGTAIGRRGQVVTEWQFLERFSLIYMVLTVIVELLLCLPLKILP